MKTTITLTAAGFLLVLAATSESQDSFEIGRYAIAAGGATSAGSGYVVRGLIGQAVVDGPSSGGGFAVTGGFRRGEINDLIFGSGYESDE